MVGSSFLAEPWILRWFFIMCSTIVPRNFSRSRNFFFGLRYILYLFFWCHVLLAPKECAWIAVHKTHRAAGDSDCLSAPLLLLRDELAHGSLGSHKLPDDRVGSPWAPIYLREPETLFIACSRRWRDINRCRNVTIVMFYFVIKSVKIFKVFCLLHFKIT